MTLMTNSSTIARATAAVVLTAALSGCTLDAVNPGPIQADQLNNVGALASLVNGTGRDLAEALNWTSYTGAAASREIFPGGSTGSFGITVRQQSGKLTEDDDDTFWNLSQRSRWTAEDVVSRAKTVLGAAAANSVQHAQALVWAGFSNRHLGENFCQGVINGGAPQAHTIYFDRAEANFTEAITVATAANNTALVQAATAGRASVRLYKGNFAAAATDAARDHEQRLHVQDAVLPDRTGSVQSHLLGEREPAVSRAHRLEHAERGLSQGDARSARSVRLERHGARGRCGGGQPRARAVVLPDQVPRSHHGHQPGLRLGNAPDRGRGEVDWW
jgi:hypothetical protein